MAGTKYNTKEALINAFKVLIFPNKKKEITGVNHQTSGLDLIESLWPTSTCTSEVFTTTTNGATITVTRIVCGTSVTLIGRVTNDAVAAAKRCDLANVIPLDYDDHLWFKMESFVSVMNSTGGGGSNGYVELSEISSYTSGSAVPDFTMLHLPGNSKGTGRTYLVDAFDQSVGTSTRLLDKVDNGETDNYITSSPLDLTTTPLRISYITAEQAVADGHTVSSTTSSTNTDMSFVIKGQLI